ncbi:hypothetical protein CEXT_537311 [Caerostris extrusa]|uniref:Uncharacterized protein n=1 Tax=Caerostris extrusa TaxID=172846 RepID=A0AAV4RLN4_CAEEX|nr:hypothetical protein CEXT_537311 [Caerostris extrusa]
MPICPTLSPQLLPGRARNIDTRDQTSRYFDPPPPQPTNYSSKDGVRRDRVENPIRVKGKAIYLNRSSFSEFVLLETSEDGVRRDRVENPIRVKGKAIHFKSIFFF